MQSGLERQRQARVVSGRRAGQVLGQVGARRARSPLHGFLNDALAARREVLHCRLPAPSRVVGVSRQGWGRRRRWGTATGSGVKVSSGSWSGK